jgi:hypothetical protein
MKKAMLSLTSLKNSLKRLVGGREPSSTSQPYPAASCCGKSSQQIRQRMDALLKENVRLTEEIRIMKEFIDREYDD